MTDLDRLIQILRRATGISQELAERTAKMWTSLGKEINLDAPLQENIKLIRESINEFDIQDDLTNKLVLLGGSVVAAHPDLKPIKITKKLVSDALSNVMPESNVSTKNLIKRTKDLTLSSTINFTTQAYTEGWTERELRNQLRTTASQLDRNLSMIARTSVNAVSNETKKKLYNANDDIVDRVLFSATFDSRTSNICKSLDGSVFLLKDAPTLPLHPNERSQLLPVLIGEDVEQVKKYLLPKPAVVPKTRKDFDSDAEFEKYKLQNVGITTRTGKVRKPRRAKTSPLKGVTTDSANYESWLRKQPKYYQVDILGIAATDKFRKGAALTQVIDTSPVTQKFLDKAIKPGRPTIIKPKAVSKVGRPIGFDKADIETTSFINSSFQDVAYSKILKSVSTPTAIGDRKDGAYYINSKINMGVKTPDSIDGQVVYRHEFGHYVDNMHGNDDQFESQVSSTKVFTDAMDRDKKLVNDQDKSFFKDALVKLKDHDSFNYLSSGRLNTGKKAVIELETIAREVTDLLEGDLLPGPWLEKHITSDFGKMVVANTDIDAMSVNTIVKIKIADEYNHNGKWSDVLRTIGSTKRVDGMYIPLTGGDLLGAITNEKWGGGHGKNYYKSHKHFGVSYGNHTEAFANAFTLNDTGSGDYGNAIVKQLAPNLLGQLQDFLK